MKLAEHIKSIREAGGLSQHELATRAGITQAMVSKLENALLDPRLSTLNAVLGVLGEELVSVDVKRAFHLKREQQREQKQSWRNEVWVSDDD